MHNQGSASGNLRVMPGSHYAPKTKIMQIQADTSPKHTGVSPKNVKEIFKYRVSHQNAGPSSGVGTLKPSGGSQAAQVHGTITYAGNSRKQQQTTLGQNVSEIHLHM